MRAFAITCLTRCTPLTTMQCPSILGLAAVSVRGPIRSSTHVTTTLTPASALPGRAGVRSSGWAQGSTTPMVNSTIRTCRSPTDRKSVVRVGAGIYHTDGQLDDQNLPISNTVDRYSFKSTAFPNLSYPLDPFLTYAMNGGLGVVSPRDLDRNRKDNYVAAWTVSVEQSLPMKFVATLSYLGNKGTDILTTTYTNLAVPPSNTAPYPAFGV